MLATPPASWKNHYTIGGFSEIDPDVFLHKWRPLFQDYLTSVVGKQFEPVIQFELIAVDYPTTASLQTAIETGAVDFVCEY